MTNQSTGKPSTHRSSKFELSFAAAVMRPAWLYLEESTSKLLTGKSKEERIHQTRITLRQLRTTLSNFKQHFNPVFYQEAKNCLRSLTNDLAILRELDVFSIELNRLSSGNSTQVTADEFLYLQQQVSALRGQYTSQLQTDVEAYRNSPGRAGIQLYMAQYENYANTKPFPPKRIHQTITAVIQRHVEQIRLLEPSLATTGPSDAFHALRIEFKGLRYSLDAFQPYFHSTTDNLILPLKSLQDCMGEIHDRQTWIDSIYPLLNESSRVSPAEANQGVVSHPIQRLFPNWQADIIQQYQTFLVLWDNLEQQNYWELLMQQTNKFLIV